MEIVVDVDGIASLNPFRFKSYYWDNETNLYYLNTRYYDPETGRFISPDKIEVLDVMKNHINGLNLYAYCLNNPINMSDDTGMLPRWLTITVGVLVPPLGVVMGIGALIGGTIYAAQGNGFASGAETGAGWGAVVGLGLVAGALFIAASVVTGGLATAALIGAGAGIISGMIGSAVVQTDGFSNFSNIDPWSMAGAGAVGGVIGAAVGIAGFFGAQIGSFMLSHVAAVLSTKTAIGTTATFGSVFGSNLMIYAGGLAGGVIGSSVAGWIVNNLANDLFGDRQHDRSSDFAVRRIVDIFRWLIPKIR